MRNTLIVWKLALKDVTTGNSEIGPAITARASEWVVHAEWLAGTSAGAVTVESAPYEGYTGTWQSIGTLTWSAASKADGLNFTGLHGAIRMRVSTTVVGGTVRVHIGGRSS